MEGLAQAARHGVEAAESVLNDQYKCLIHEDGRPVEAAAQDFGRFPDAVCGIQTVDLATLRLDDDDRAGAVDVSQLSVAQSPHILPPQKLEPLRLKVEEGVLRRQLGRGARI